MQQSETEHWREREQDYADRIEQLERQLQQQISEVNRFQGSDRVSIQGYEERILKLQAEWRRREEVLEETIQTLRSRLEGQHNNGNKHRLEIEELKQYIVEAVETPAQQLRQKQLEFLRDMEHLKMEHSQASESLRIQFRIEIEDLTRRLRQAETERNSL